MNEEGIRLEALPKLKYPTLIAGFEGWGNAMEVSSATMDYLVDMLKAKRFASINSDMFYCYDMQRPLVTVEDGELKSLHYPGGSFYAAWTESEHSDLILLKAVEPNIRWHRFIDDVLLLCSRLECDTIITLGSLFDNVLHSDRLISGAASTPSTFAVLKEQNVIPIAYDGPCAIHSGLHSEGTKRGFRCISLWCHCPMYLEGVVHFGAVFHLVSLISALCHLNVDTLILEKNWRELNQKIHELINENPDLQETVKEIRKSKLKEIKDTLQDQNVIRLSDFMK